MSQLAIDPEAINQYLAQQIAESAIGEVLKDQIDKAVSDLSKNYNNPFEAVIRQHVTTEIQRIVTEDYSELLNTTIKELVTADMIERLIREVWQKLSRGY